MDTKFSMEEVEKTFASYNSKKATAGIVVALRENGVVFNLGGKLDAFISKEELEDFDNAKIGDRFSVILTGERTEDGMVKASQKKAIKLEIETQNAREIKLGYAFPFVVEKTTKDGGLFSKMGEFEIVVPPNEICSTRTVNPKHFIGKKVEAIATEINAVEKTIKASIRILDDKTRQANEEIFWKTNFINKIVEGKVKNIVPFGAFVDVGGVNCLLHISNISNSHIESPSDVLEVGKTYKFKILSLNRETKKVSLGLKQLSENAKP